MDTSQLLTLSGTLLKVFGQGILITGESGIGKSEIALSLINQGHILIADDIVEVYREKNHLIGTCPTLLESFLECREIGILNMVALYGQDAIVKNTPIHLNISLCAKKSFIKNNRPSPSEKHVLILDCEIPQYTLAMIPGRDYPLLIQTIVRHHYLKTQGYDPTNDFISKQQRLIREQT